MNDKTQTPKNIWQHRISHSGYFSYPLLEKGILSIGFSDFTDDKTINMLNNHQETRANFDRHVKEIAQKKWEGDFSNMRTHYNLWLFAKMRKGDWVLVPKPYKFSIYEVSEDNLYRFSELGMPIPANPEQDNEPLFTIDEEDKNKIKDVDLGFFRKVTPVCEGINRASFADAALNSRMKARQTTLDISALQNNVNEAINRYKEKKPINIHTMVSDLIDKKKLVDEVLSIIQNYLNPDEFERLIKWYFESIGATDVNIPSKNDPKQSGPADADIIADFKHLKTTFYVQAKHHKGEESAGGTEWAQEQVEKASKQREKKGDSHHLHIKWVLSSCNNYANEKKAKADAKEENIQLINGLEFSMMLLEAGILNLEYDA